MATMTSHLLLPWPPSLNRYWRAINGRNILSREGREYRKRAVAACLAQGAPRFRGARLSVYISVVPPDKRKRDLDNLLKALLDALQHAQVIDDDAHIDELTIRRVDGIGPFVGVRVEAL